MPPTRSQLQIGGHRRHIAYRTRRAAEHDAAGEPEAAAKHRAAIVEHEAAALKPLYRLLSNEAMRASAVADEVSQRVGRDK